MITVIATATTIAPTTKTTRTVIMIMKMRRKLQ